MKDKGTNVLRIRLILALVIIGLSACSHSPLPESTATPIPSLTPTFIPTSIPTPEPTFLLSGIVFFDYNGNGILDGDEPGIPDASIQVGDLVAITDVNGNYTLPGLTKGKKQIQLAANGFRYVSLSLEGFQPSEQPIALQIESDTLKDWGIMQGFLTLPYQCEAQSQVYVSTYYDLDPVSGKVRNFRGDTIRRNCNRDVVIESTCDDHWAIDYIMPAGVAIVAAAPGEVNYADTLPNGVLQITLDHFVGNKRYQTGYGHLSKMLVSFGNPVSRGQIIGLSGGTGVTEHHPPSQIEHLHFALFDELAGWENPHSIDPYRDLYDLNSENWWTKDNEPQCTP